MRKEICGHLKVVSNGGWEKIMLILECKITKLKLESILNIQNV